MTMNYFKNMGGCRLSESQMENISCPRSEVFSHIMIKNVQAGVLIGAGIVGPIISVVNGKRDCESIKDSAYACARKGAIVGLVVTPIMSIARLAMIDQQGGWDRAYRLRYSSQNFVDRMSILGALTGAGVAHYKGGDRVRGAIFGFAGGVVVGGLLNAFF